MRESKRPRGKYKTTNWAAYNAALKTRGSLTVWLNKDLQGYAPASGKRGRPGKFSDTAIQFCLSLKCLFGLAQRQSLGMVESLLRLGIDAQTLEIRAIEVTDNRIGDAPMLPELLSQIPEDAPIASVGGDGAYDTKACHAAIARRNAHALIPPRKHARAWKNMEAGAASRNEARRACQCLGRTIWKKWSGYHRRSLVETRMYCFKRLGERVLARTFERQVAELHMRVALLNRFTQLGRPQTVAMA